MKILYYLLMFTCLMVFLCRRKHLGKSLFLMGPLLICSISVELVTEYQRKFLHAHDWYQYHIFQPVEFIILTLLFYANMKSHAIRTVMLVSIPVFIIVITSYYLVHPRSFNSEKFIDFQLESFFLIIWAILYLVELINTDHVVDSILRIPFFWISFAVLLFFSGNMFIMGFRDFLAKHHAGVRNTIMLVPQYLNLIFYFMIIIGFLCKPTRKKSFSA
ncbi:hypothetical protein [Dyadobacter sp. CY326]|uniref:hypothetical protein n=1 Tax=Dyadobacter sp. CY326 TaxID=2907300 RepID=UPI001F46DE86|nr:hypothetical protein [Dyadobacter sp. CY326]MCE7066658.1 hypothetical protein [Dyadobacter sp. CY326]